MEENIAVDTRRSAPNELEILMERASICLQNKEWLEADKYYSRVLERSGQYALAWVGLLCVELKLSSEEELATVRDPDILSEHYCFKSALEYADSKTKVRLEGYIQTVQARIVVARKIVSEADYKALLEFHESNFESYKQRGKKLRVTVAGIDWIVLDFEGSEVLLLAEKVLEEPQRYHDELEIVTWEECSLNKYLNGQFLDELGDLQTAIIEKDHENRNNQWYQTPGGEDTKEKVFLLSLRELIDYFGYSGRLDNRQGQESCFSDQFYEARVAYNVKGEKCLWWLRSPGNLSYRAAFVDGNGAVNVDGLGVNYDIEGVRPAFWLNLESEIF